MDLSIVITTRNRKKDLLECIDSVKKSDFKGIEYELIIVDDASDDGTEKITHEDIILKNLKIIHNDTQQMMVRSRNIGAKNSSGKYTLFIDDDNVIDEDMINNLVDFAENYPEFGLIGPSMYFFESKEKYMDYQKISLVTGKTSYFIGNKESNYYDSDGIPNVFIIKKEAFEVCGYFDEKLIQTYTEPDFAKITSFAFSSENLSKITREPLCLLIPYIIPSSIVRSDDVNGKVVAKLVVSMFRVIKSLSSPAGMDDWNASSICKDAVLEISNNAPKVDSSFAVTDSSSSRELAGIVM